MGPLLCVLVALGSLAFPSLAVAQTSGLVAAYGFSEGSGTTVADASGNGNAGTLTNGPVWTAGKNGTGLSFDGVNDFVNLSNPTSLRLTGSMTLSAWIKSSNFPFDDAAIISKRQSSNTGYQLDTTIDGGPRTLGFKISDAAGNTIARYGATAMVLNTWYHVAGVYNAASRTMTVYLNGQLDNGTLTGTIPASQSNSNQNVNLGRRPGVPGTFNFAGVMDDVRIYNRVLSQAEIQSDMATPVGGALPPDTTPPSVSLTAPAASAIVSGTAVTVSATASDDRGVTGVQFLLDGASLGAEDVAAPYSVVWNTTTSASGAHALSARARDAAGNVATSPPVTVVVDNDPPSGTIVINGGAAATNNRAVTLTLSAGDALSGVTQMRFSDTGTSYSAAQAYATSATWTLPTGAGTKTVYAQFRDGAGNWSAAATDTIVLDTTAPTISGTAAGAITAASATVTWTTNEAATSQVNYGLTTSYGQTTTLDAALVTSHSVVLTGLAPLTTYNYRVRSRDAAGNEAVSGNFTLTTLAGSDTTAPVVSLTAPAANATVSGVVTVSATASDAVGVVGVQFLLDGAALGAEDTTSPYSVSWNTATAANGVHTLSARARDAAGNVGTASPVTVTVANTVSSSGLAAGWNFNEGTGSLAHDVSGNNNTASVSSASAWTVGHSGGGLAFSGNTFLSVPSSVSLDVSGNALTVSLWIQPQSPTGGDAVVIGKFWNAGMTAPYYQYGIELEGGATPRFFVGTAGGVVSAGMGSALVANQWSHLAVVFNGAQAQFYLNGVPTAPQPLAASLTARGQPLRIGADANGAQILDATLDDVRIYARVLSQAEVQTDMNSPLGGVAGSDSTPPTVALTFPPNNAQLADIVTVTAQADDNVGVAGVRFLVDGVPVDVEDTQAPYGFSWDTRTVANGVRTVTARARDAAGNVTLSSPVTVNVANTNFFQNEILATGFNLPTSIAFLPDGRLLVVELQGVVKVLPPPYTQPSPTPFLVLSNVGAAGVQQGIYYLALDPDFTNNRFYYLFYTAGTPNRDRLSRFTANASLTGTVAGSEVVLYQDPQDANAEHHGGAIAFGNDGKLYFTTGEHFNPPDAQLLSSPRGKIHRINKDGTVPTDNPFYDGPGPNWDSVWARGLRNPFRAYYDGPTGRLFVADVGGNDYSVAKEEVNLGAAGANYGWPDSEGPCSAPCTSPIYFYPHNGRDAAITGGFVYRGTQFPSAYQGNYFFADYTQNWIRRLTFDGSGTVTGVFNFEPIDGSVDGPYGDIVDLAQGPDGALYYVDLGYSDIGGTFGISKIRRIRYVQSNQAPVAVASASVTKGPAPLTVAFSSAGSLDPEGQPLTYSWTFGDSTTSTQPNPSHVYSQSGQYTVRLSVSDGVTTTLAAPLLITVGNAPSVTILSPPNNLVFRAGDVIAFSGAATDTEDGTLPASAFTWNIDFLHEGHVHPGLPITGTKSGSFTIPTTGHDFSGNTRYRITLTVTDSDGLPSTQSVLVYPDKVNLSFATVPSGLTLYLDGIARVAPFVYDTLIGFIHTVEAPEQTGNGTTYTFASWSDGGAQQHQVTVAVGGQSYTATYAASALPLPAGLAAAWTFSEGTGSSASDASGHGNTATLVNGVTWAAGRYGGGLSFNGANGHLAVPNSSSLDIAGSQLTLTVWMNLEALPGGDSVVLGKFWNTAMTTPYYQYGLELAGGRQPAFYLGTPSGVQAAYMGSDLPLGQWSHVAVVFNGSQAQFYVNGGLVSAQPLAASIQARGNSLKIGADATPAQFYQGFLDEIRIYNRALSPAEIQTDMTTALVGGF